MRKTLKHKTIFGLAVAYILYVALVIVSNVEDQAIAFPAPQDYLTLDRAAGSLKFAVIADPESGERMLVTALQRKGTEVLLPLQQSHEKHFGAPLEAFANSHALVANIESAKRITHDLIAREQATDNPSPVILLKDATLRPFLDPPTKVIHGAQSMDHYRNSKRAAVRRNMPFVARFILIPFNFITGDGFYSLSEKDRHFDFFHGNNIGLFTTGDEVPLPGGIEEIDVEAELAVVISRAGHNISPENAMQHVAGFMFFNDFTDRHEQHRERSRSYTGYQESKYISSMGAFLVTDLDPARFAVRTRVNGHDVATSCADEIIDFMPLDEQIAHYSKFYLASGQVIALGTMRGGSLFELDLPMLRPGDTVEFIANQGLGSTWHRIVQP